MSIARPKSSDLRLNKVTFQVDTRPQNPDLSSNEAWADHIKDVWLAIQDGDTREPEVMGRREDQRTLQCWGCTQVLKQVEADMRFIWYDPQTDKTWNVKIDSHPVEIERDHTFMKFSATATLVQDR